MIYCIRCNEDLLHAKRAFDIVVKRPCIATGSRKDGTIIKAAAWMDTLNAAVK